MVSQVGIETAERAFKSCPFCRRVWPTRLTLLRDCAVILVGYQVNFLTLKKGLFLFNHATCGTTFSVKVEGFLDFRVGPVIRARRTGENECPGYCLRMGELGPCPAECECASVREILQAVREWPKDNHRDAFVGETEQTAGIGVSAC
jgi:hypothetical protein